MSLQHPPKALLTDVFGTVVDWRNTVNAYLLQMAQTALNDPSTIALSSEIRSAAARVCWPDFAQEWRNSYYKFTRGFDPEKVAFKTIDDHHIDSLRELIAKYRIQGLWTEDRIKEISLIWHKLDAWVDSSPGLQTLAEKHRISTLSNGNASLLLDLAQHGDLAYHEFLCAEDFQAYKPHPRVYQGACTALGFPPSQCAMVAAHLNDLQAAKAQGMQTIYIERVGEESWGPERIAEARTWVDMWISLGEGGFVEIARRFAK